MQFRFAHKDEIPSLTRLVSHSFIGRSSEFWAEQLQDPAHGGGQMVLYVGFDGDQPIASLQLYPLRQWIAGRPLAMAGVGTVTVAPTHRQKGVAGKLMQQALRAAVERGDVASALYPFRTSFYQKLGYGHAGVALQYLVAPDSLPASDERARIELLYDEAQHETARALYNNWIRTENGQVERTAKMWKSKFAVADSVLAAYRGAGGDLEGYAFALYRPDLVVTDRYLDVNEMIWTTDAARRGILGWLASLADQWKRIMLRGLPSYHLNESISEPKRPYAAVSGWGLWWPVGTQLYGPMFRILDVQKTWDGRSSAGDVKLTVSLHITDGQIEENSGDWRLDITPDGCRLKRGGGGGDVAIRTNISTLSRLYCNAIPAGVALQAGLLECDRPDRLAALDEALRLPEPWMFDRF
jgi:predicted acetyltransferase